MNDASKVYEPDLDKLISVSKLIDMHTSGISSQEEYGKLQMEISTCPVCSLLYASYLKGRFQMGEDAIASNPWSGLMYARDVIKSRFVKMDLLHSKNSIHKNDMDVKAEEEYEHFLNSRDPIKALHEDSLSA